MVCRAKTGAFPRTDCEGTAAIPGYGPPAAENFGRNEQNMSASREKKKRQELLASGAADPKAARAAEQRAAERRSNLLYAAVGAAFAVVVAALLVYNSGILQRGQTAVTIDGQKYTVPQTAYYYQEVCGSYASMFGQEYLQSLKAQSYSEDQTWDDYFKAEAVDNMKYVHAVTRAAKAANVSLDSEDEASVKAAVDSVKAAAASAGYSYGAYLKAVYGPTMTGSVFESCLRDRQLAGKYAAAYSEEHFVYTDGELQSYYEEHKDSYDVIDGAYVVVSGAPEVRTDGEGNAVEPTEAEKAAAMAEAGQTAQLILDDYKAGKDLEGAAGAHNASAVTAIASPSTLYGEWFFDESRRSGDADVLEDESGSNYYVVVFNGRRRDETPDYSVRHILVTAENLDLPEGGEATEELLRAKAEEILKEWDGTEDGFAALANQYSQDGGSNAGGGLYEDVPKGQMVSPFQDWCYEEGRRSGDTGVVYYSGRYTGAHVMYFVGLGDTPYWRYACENDMRTRDVTDWQNGLVEAAVAEVSPGGMKNVG